MASERTPEQRGLIGILHNLLDDPLNLDLRDKLVDRLVEYELKARLRVTQEGQGNE